MQQQPQKNQNINESEILITTSEEIQKRQQKAFFNYGTKLQTSLALIFRLSPQTDKALIDQLKIQIQQIRNKDENHYIHEIFPHKYLQDLFSKKDSLKFDLMVAKRIKTESKTADIYSEQVRFLGGKCEGNREDDFQAILRQVREESALDLQDYECFSVYLGSLKKNFYCGRVPSRYSQNILKDLYTKVHVFIILDPSKTLNLKFQKNIQTIKWVPFAYFLNFNGQKDSWVQKIPNPIQIIGVFPKHIQYLAEKSVKDLYFLYLNVGFDTGMWGMNAVGLIYFMSVVINGIQRKYQGKKYKEISENWKIVFKKYSQTRSDIQCSFVQKKFLEYYYNLWKNNFQQIYNENEQFDPSFALFICSSAIFFSAYSYYSIQGSGINKPSL